MSIITHYSTAGDGRLLEGSFIDNTDNTELASASDPLSN